MPALCNGDYAAMELMHAKLVRNMTCGTGDLCDYTIYGDKDENVNPQCRRKDIKSHS